MNFEKQTWATNATSANVPSDKPIDFKAILKTISDFDNKYATIDAANKETVEKIECLICGRKIKMIAPGNMMVCEHVLELLKRQTPDFDADKAISPFPIGPLGGIRIHVYSNDFPLREMMFTDVFHPQQPKSFFFGSGHE